MREFSLKSLTSLPFSAVVIISFLVTCAFSLLLLPGCSSEAGPNIYNNPNQTIEVKVGQEFIIALESNPTTGYSWQAEFDDSVLKLVESKYERTPAEEGMVGVGGTQSFEFQALKEGKAEVTMIYKRSWEESPIESKVFTINIK